ncbi:hypothetical protein [Usitatibacter palustris]|uniref:Uncharacterized protein n=1 Tax=Usitatibacter palustris TaxID=2732487 RepID=A0A6M4HAV8_9PROT|nr:hypothetical protein [Usitatibacter palustris]QJR15783.1 hypothetical protein DSM104440_02609 [Usitatibacter palustris]
MDDLNRDNDAQRTLEQKALHNVRGLVDKLEASDRAERKLQKQILVVFAVLLAVFASLWAAGIFPSKKSGETVEIVIAPKPQGK